MSPTPAPPSVVPVTATLVNGESREITCTIACKIPLGFDSGHYNVYIKVTWPQGSPTLSVTPLRTDLRLYNLTDATDTPLTPTISPTMGGDQSNPWYLYYTCVVGLASHDMLVSGTITLNVTTLNWSSTNIGSHNITFETLLTAP